MVNLYDGQWFVLNVVRIGINLNVHKSIINLLRSLCVGITVIYTTR